MDTDGPIYSGPPLASAIPEVSFGQLLFPYILKTKDEEIGHINALTGEEMTNGRFRELVFKIASGLKTLGVVAEDIVVISGENSFRNAAAAAACILLNATFAPLDPNLKTFELSNILSKYMPHYVICNRRQSEAFQNALKELGILPKIALLDEEKVQGGAENVKGFSYFLEQDARPIEPTNVPNFEKTIAVIMPSSGSTGIPKGVAISHRTLVFVASKMASWLDTGIMLQTSHLFWISGLYSVIGALLGRRRIFLPTLDATEILKTIKTYKVQSMFIPPSVLTTILKRPDLEEDAFATMRSMGLMGGALNQTIVDLMEKRLNPNPKLIHAYGLTEACVFVTNAVPGTDVLSVGRTGEDVEIRIADPEGEKTLKQGEIGEVRVRSSLVMVKYIGNPEATKAAFDQNGWLRTGDLGYFNKDDLLYITGRIKCLIKYRNMQISPEEVESLLITMDPILDVVVDGYPNKEDQYHALALVVKTPGSTLTEQAVQDYVKEHMAEHNWLRGGVFFVDSIPRNPHKKVIRLQVRKLAVKLYQERF